MEKTKKGIIGFTTTIPVELVFAAGYEPCDLNNIFITDENPMHYIERAERDGFPKSMCNWVKGIYGVVMEKGVDAVITVMEGDCSNTQALAEIFRYRGVRTIPFAFPYDRDREVLAREIDKLRKELSVDEHMFVEVVNGMKKTRASLMTIDEMTWKEGLVTGAENHLWLVRASDMLGDYERYNTSAKAFIADARERKNIEGVRLGYIGVPPIFLDLYEFIGSLGGHVVYNETQRQFVLPYDTNDIVRRYLMYTYPYGVFARLEDMKEEIKRRRIEGVIHYVQAFCYRAIEEVILRETLGVPMITIEGDMPKQLDTRTKLRIEAFIEMLTGQRT
ncbi:MAG: 2-hydroxyglutaryl-CoA dehydratase [Syntrophus sp. (in: bacteria)]|nr:2-hydroxyglutaryl-CoA dehydratase [Syntrophus sp. (in: bacteria)]